MIINGKKIRDSLLEDIKKEVKKLSFQPIFCDVLVGDDPVSRQYVNLKAKIAEKAGVKFHKAEFPENISDTDLVYEIEKLNNTENMCGIIVQLPLPNHFNKEEILNAIDPKLDIDCLGVVANSEFYKGKGLLEPPAALACVYILDSLDLDLNKKNITIVGQGELVGKPVTYLLESRGLKVNKITKDISLKSLKDADIIISGTGQGNFINKEMIKEGVVIIDAGTSESAGGVVGDVDLESVKDIVSAISPVPGGVGPVTVALLLKNVLTVAKL